MDCWTCSLSVSAKVRLLVRCCQEFTEPAVIENDTLARIGTSCLQQLLENNVKKLSTSRWERVTSTFAKLFKTTTPHQLFDDALRVEIDDTGSNIDDTPGEFPSFRRLDDLVSIRMQRPTEIPSSLHLCHHPVPKSETLTQEPTSTTGAASSNRSSSNAYCSSCSSRP